MCSLRKRDYERKYLLSSTLESPQDAPEDAEGTFGVGAVEIQATEKESKIVAIGGFHSRWRVARSAHRFFDYFAQQMECFRGDVRVARLWV